MKSSIEWHEECLKNSLQQLEGKKAEIERLTRQLKEHETRYTLYAAQIELAKKEGKDSFDSERYAIKRLCV